MSKYIINWETVSCGAGPKVNCINQIKRKKKKTKKPNEKKKKKRKKAIPFSDRNIYRDELNITY